MVLNRTASISLRLHKTKSFWWDRKFGSSRAYLICLCVITVVSDCAVDSFASDKKGRARINHGLEKTPTSFLADKSVLLHGDFTLHLADSNTLEGESDIDS